MNQNENLKLRRATVADAQNITNLVNSAYRGDSSQKGWTTEAHFLGGQRTDKEAIREMIEKPGQFFLLAEEDGKLIASANLEKINSSVCYFGMFAVDRNFQAKGLGKTVLAEAEKFAKEELGCKSMEMSVITIRQELIAFYERRGFRFTGETQAFFYGNERFGIPLRNDLELGIWRKLL